jgi:hypothetical protein
MSKALAFFIALSYILHPETPPGRLCDITSMRLLHPKGGDALTLKPNTDPFAHPSSLRRNVKDQTQNMRRQNE